MRKFAFIVLCFITCLSFMACDKDHDVTEVEIRSYLIGRWYSSHAEAIGNGRHVVTEITKTGEYAAAYYELIFKADGTYSFGYWLQDNYGISRWKEEPGNYSVKGDIVSLMGPDDETIDFLFDSGQRTLSVRGQTTINGVNVVVNIYLKKY